VAEFSTAAVNPFDGVVLTYATMVKARSDLRLSGRVVQPTTCPRMAAGSTSAGARSGTTGDLGPVPDGGEGRLMVLLSCHR
jgi:hypothetical protein